MPSTLPRIVLVLSENWTIVDPRRPRDLVEVARIAEDEGIDTVMLSEHVVLGPSAGADGIMGNPRDYAMPGNQDPAMPWPDSIVLASAIAAATSTLRIALAGRATDGELARGRVCGAGRAVSSARCTPRRPPGGVAGTVA